MLSGGRVLNRRPTFGFEFRVWFVNGVLRKSDGRGTGMFFLPESHGSTSAEEFRGIGR